MDLRPRLVFLIALWVAVLMAPAADLMRPARGRRTAQGAVIFSSALFFDKARSDTNPLDLEIMARRSALIFGASAKQVPMLRAFNPGLKVILYDQPGGTHEGARDYEEIDRHEAWWVHDDHGSRMRETGGFGDGVWLLHMGRPEYRTYAQTKIITEVALYDGVFMDTSNPYWPIYRDWVDVRRDPTTPPADVLRNWPDWMVSFHERIAQALGARLHIFNSWPQTPDRYEEFRAHLQETLATVDGTQFDGFCYNRSQPWSLAKWQYQIASAQRLVQMGRVVLLKTPLDDMRDDPAELLRWQTMCFSSYLLAADGKHAQFRSVDEADVSYWNELLFRAPIGAPEGPFYRAQGVYRRDFINGAALVNPTLLAATVDLGGTYFTLEGVPVTVIRLRPQTGIVLLEVFP